MYKSITITRILSSLTLILFISTIGLAQTLPKDIAALALENNALLKERSSLILAAQEKKNQSTSFADPMVNLGVFAMPIETRNGPQRFSIALSQSLPWFGVRSLRESVAMSDVEIKSSELRFEQNRLLFQLEKLWIERTSLSEQIELLDDLYSRTAFTLEILKSQTENGSASFSDVLSMDINLQEIEIERTSMKKKIFSIESELLGFIQAEINFESSSFPDFGELPLAPDDSEIESLLTSSELLISANLKIEQSKKALRLVSASQKPSISLGANYFMIGETAGSTNPDNGKDALLLPQIGISIPLWRSKNVSQRKEAEYRASAANHQRDQIMAQTKAQLESALISYSEAKLRGSQINTLIESSQTIINQVDQELEQGLRTYLQVLPSIQKDIALRRKSIQSKRDALLSYANITFLISAFQ